jgi:hypothetical protein
MKIEIPFLAGLLLVGNNLFVRLAVQGVEQALFSTAIEYGWNVIKSSKGLLHETVRRPCFLSK